MSLSSVPMSLCAGAACNKVNCNAGMREGWPYYRKDMRATENCTGYGSNYWSASPNANNVNKRGRVISITNVGWGKARTPTT